MISAKYVCEICFDTGWVCERHPHLAWDLSCDCSPGILCACNVLDENGEPIKSGIVEEIKEAH